MKPLIETNQRAVDVAILLLRFMAGLILFVAGAGKVLGWFGRLWYDDNAGTFQNQYASFCFLGLFK
jgi:uncharacterized membrane protein YphA (DoxX/SURF4 family)